MNSIAYYPLRALRKAAAVIAISGLFLTSANAGNVFLTGHDVLLHSGQNGYDAVILDYLRNGEGTRASYNVLYVTSGGTPGGLASVIAEGFNVTQITHAAFGAAPAAALAGKSAFVLPWWYDGEVAGNAAVTSAASKAAIEAFFNSGGDIWGNSSHSFPQYYNFLPAGVAASGPELAGNPSSGFLATPEGTAIGITSGMINGNPTHNVFSTFAPAFTVFERYQSQTGSVISIGLVDGIITTGGITTGGVTTGGVTSVPDAGSASFLLLFGLGTLAAIRRSNKR